MRGLMMDSQLTIDKLLDRAAALYARREIVSRRPDRSLHRYTVADFVDRSWRLAAALQRLGVKPGDRVGTLAWNHYQHLEAYFGVPSIGAVLHTLNLRLHPDDLAYIVRHGGDRVLLVDEVLLPLLEKVRERIDVESVVVMRQETADADRSAGSAAGAPGGSGAPVVSGEAAEGPEDLDYEGLLASVSADDVSRPRLDEHAAAAMCFTSGTTGLPKGVVYSHRSTVLHSLALGLADLFAIRERSVFLPVVPMFHVNAWGAPYTCVLVGAKQVFPGPHLDAASLCELFAAERVTMTAGVPTIWLDVLDHLDRNPGRYDLSAMEVMLVGGAAAPPSMIHAFEQRHGLRVVHAWGMTETSPLGTVSRLCPETDDLSEQDKLALRAKQGRMAPLVQVRARGKEGIVPWDGETMGELEVRGPWIASAYYDSDQGSENFTQDGWFRTGDIVTIDPLGYIRIEDRSKDLIKSGGEWISSIALENALMGHPKIAEAAVIPVPHERWIERPLAVVVPVPGETVTLEQVRAWLEPHFARWWLPDALEIVDQIPRTSTGKFKKSVLRERFRDLRLS